MRIWAGSRHCCAWPASTRCTTTTSRRRDRSARRGARQRIVLTRDRELLKRRTITHGCYVRALRRRPSCAKSSTARPGARRAAVHAVPALQCAAAAGSTRRWCGTAAGPGARRYERFSAVASRRVFWEGSHWRSMRLDGRRVAGAAAGRPRGREALHGYRDEGRALESWLFRFAAACRASAIARPAFAGHGRRRRRLDSATAGTSRSRSCCRARRSNLRTLRLAPRWHAGGTRAGVEVAPVRPRSPLRRLERRPRRFQRRRRWLGAGSLLELPGYQLLHRQRRLVLHLARHDVAADVAAPASWKTRFGRMV